MSAKFARLLWDQVTAHDLGEVWGAGTGCIPARDPDTVLAAAVTFVRRDRAVAESADDGFWLGAPELAVEVVSLNDRRREVADKVARWLRYGTRMVVVVDPQRQLVEVHRPDQPVQVLGVNDTLDGGNVVPGWTLAIRNLFT